MFVQDEDGRPKPLQDAAKIVAVGENCLTVRSLRDYMRISVVKEWKRTAPPNVSLMEGLINRGETCVNTFITVMALRQEGVKHGWAEENPMLYESEHNGLDLYAGLYMRQIKMERFLKEKARQAFLSEIRGNVAVTPDEATWKSLIREIATLVAAEIDVGKAKDSNGDFCNAEHMAESKQASEMTAIGEIDLSSACADNDLVCAMTDAVKDALQKPQSMMVHNVFHMATFPSWEKFDGGAAYSVGEFVCIWRKKPLLDIEADPSKWVVGLAEGYEARIKGLERSGLGYLHSFAVYRRGVFKGDVPVPVIVFTVEKSNHAKKPYVCAFTPEGHKNFKTADLLSGDKEFLHAVLAAVCRTLDKVPERIGDAEKGLSLLKQMKDKPKGDKTTCTK